MVRTHAWHSSTTRCSRPEGRWRCVHAQQHRDDVSPGLAIRGTERENPSKGRAMRTAHTHAHTCTHMHTHAHTCTHMHTHAYTFTFTPVLKCESGACARRLAADASRHHSSVGPTMPASKQQHEHTKRANTTPLVESGIHRLSRFHSSNNSNSSSSSSRTVCKAACGDDAAA